jgi:hypothetical protein
VIRLNSSYSKWLVAVCTGSLLMLEISTFRSFERSELKFSDFLNVIVYRSYCVLQNAVAAINQIPENVKVMAVVASRQEDHPLKLST